MKKPDVSLSHKNGEYLVYNTADWMYFWALLLGFYCFVYPYLNSCSSYSIAHFVGPYFCPPWAMPAAAADKAGQCTLCCWEHEKRVGKLCMLSWVWLGLFRVCFHSPLESSQDEWRGCCLPRLDIPERGNAGLNVWQLALVRWNYS